MARQRRFKTPDEMAKRLDLINGESPPDELPVIERESVRTFSGLKKLSEKELLSRLRQIDNQATLMKWRIWWAIRQKYKSDKLFGQHLNELRDNPDYAHFVGSQQDINRAYHAGRFCEKHKIVDLDNAKVPISAIYELSRPANDGISDAVYKEIKSSVRRRIKLNEVNRLIARESAVHTVEKSPQAPEIERMSYELGGRHVVEVKDGIAQTADVIDQEAWDDSARPDPVTRAEVFKYPQRPVEPQPEQDELSNEKIADDVMAFVAQYNLRWDRLIAVFQLCIDKSRVFPKR